jgi:hypothetical protein
LIWIKHQLAWALMSSDMPGDEIIQMAIRIGIRKWHAGAPTNVFSLDLCQLSPPGPDPMLMHASAKTPPAFERGLSSGSNFLIWRA